MKEGEKSSAGIMPTDLKYIYQQKRLIFAAKKTLKILYLPFLLTNVYDNWYPSKLLCG